MTPSSPTATARDQIDRLRAGMGRAIIGQCDVIDRLVIGLLANGNLLIEGMPGLAKTRAVKAMARQLDARFSRIRFTPDLLPADVTGTEIYVQTGTGGTFRFDPGPIFANIVLAEEINRAPAKLQAALLEAMEERQITVAGSTRRKEPLFIVMATQNPIEQVGTYPLPEAQMDRFLMHVAITYPPVEDEVEVIRLVRGEERAAQPEPGAAAASPGGNGTGDGAIPQQAIFAARRDIAAIHVSDAMDRDMAELVQATRNPAALDPERGRWIALAASPRAALALDKCGRAHAWLNGRGYVDPLDIRAIAPDVFRHRLTQSYEAQGEGIAADQVIAALLDRVVLRIARKNALVLVFSDFDTLDAETEPLNAALARANDLILFNIADPLSERLPEGFRAMVSDGDLQAELDGRRAETRARIERAMGERLGALFDWSRRHGAPLLPLSTDRSARDQLLALLGHPPGAPKAPKAPRRPGPPGRRGLGSGWDRAGLADDRLDLGALEEIARRSGGRFFRAQDRAALQQVYAEIDVLTPREAETDSYRPARDLAHLPLTAAPALLPGGIAAMHLRARRPVRPGGTA